MQFILKKISLIFSFLLISSGLLVLNAQTPETDSLENILQKHQEKDTIRVNLLNKTAYVLRKINIDKTFNYAKEAGQIADSLSYAKGKAESFRMIGISYYEKYEYANAIEYYQKSLHINKKIDNKYNIAKVFTNMANVYYYMSDFKQALEYYKKSLKIYENLNCKNEISYSYYCFAYAYKGLGEYDKTFEYFKKAILIKEELGDITGIAYFLNRLGSVYREMGDYGRALDYYQKSLIIKEKINDQFGIATTLKDLGSLYREQAYYDKALEYYKKSLKISKDIGDKRLIFNNLNDLGVVYKELKMYDKALYYCQKSLEVIEEVGTNTGIAESYNNIGSIYKETGEYKKALKYYQKSFTLSISLNLKDMQAENYLGLADLYLAQNKKNKAYTNSKKAYNIAKQIGNAVLQKESSELLAKSCEALGFYKDAYKYHLIFKTMSDSLFNVKNAKKLANIEYENEKQTIELEQQRKDAIRTEKEKQQKIIRNSFLVGLILMIIIALIVFNGFINKRKANRVLAFQNLEIEEINEELTQQKDEIETQTENLATANEKLQELNATKDKFFSIIAHDLRSPFSALMVYSDLLLENHKEYDEEEREGMIKSISDSSENTFRLLENLLTWSRSQSGIIEFLPKKIKIKPFINEIVLLLQQTAINKNISLSSDIDIDMCIYADENMISTVLRNFITNAIKFTRKNGTVIVSANETNKSGFIEISVKDTGVGISKDKINNLFYIDKNISTLGTEDETGTGLGLILCKEFIEKNNGKISVESEVGKGSKFTFIIPQSI